MATRLSLILAPIGGFAGAVIGGLLGRKGKNPAAPPRTESVNLLVLLGLGAMALGVFVAVLMVGFISGNC